MLPVDILSTCLRVGYDVDSGKILYNLCQQYKEHQLVLLNLPFFCKFSWYTCQPKIHGRTRELKLE